MSIKRNTPQIFALRQHTESRLEKKLVVHADFQTLVAEIEREQRLHISETTLERVWGYSTRGYETVSLHTLDVLAKYAANCDWETFCKRLHEEDHCESELFNTEHIASDELVEGDCLRIGWLPNRICDIRYLGSNRFLAEHCENSKLQSGDIFSCWQFALNQPLNMTDLYRNNQLIGSNYVVGQKNGLTTLVKLKSSSETVDH